jgi:predicted regulator of Ras-like GTPase activity (Roadblock/LC7/MglB family)
MIRSGTFESLVMRRVSDPLWLAQQELQRARNAAEAASRQLAAAGELRLASRVMDSVEILGVHQHAISRKSSTVLIEAIGEGGVQTLAELADAGARMDLDRPDRFEPE